MNTVQFVRDYTGGYAPVFDEKAGLYFGASEERDENIELTKDDIDDIMSYGTIEQIIVTGGFYKDEHVKIKSIVINEEDAHYDVEKHEVLGACNNDYSLFTTDDSVDDVPEKEYSLFDL